MAEAEEIKRLTEQVRQDLALIKKAAQVLGEIGRSEGLSDEHADVLAALRLRIEGKPRKSLEDLLQAAGEISGKKDIAEVLRPEDDDKSDWSEIKETKRDWPGP